MIPASPRASLEDFLAGQVNSRAIHPDAMEAGASLDEIAHQHLAEIMSSIPKQITRFDVPTISPLSHVRMSEYATTVTVPRYDSNSTFQPYSDYSPYSSSPSTAVNSRAPSPTKDLDEYDEEPLPSHDRLLWRLASGFFALFVGGWADGVTGTVMPYLSADFHMNSTLSSSLFAGTTCGVFAGTFLVESIMGYLGTFRVHRNESSFFSLLPFRKKTAFDDNLGYSITQARFLILVIASIMHSTYFIMMGSRSGFPVMFLAYVMSAFSRTLLSAPLNAYFAEGPKQALGYGLGLASLGSVISPLVCQSIIATGVPWYRFYYGSLVLSGLNVLFLFVTFKPTAAESFRARQKALYEGRRRKSEFLLSGRSSPVNGINVARDSTPNLDFQSKSKSALRSALALPYQWAFSCFILLYCGSETSTQGFMVTYLLSTRHANPKTIGYVTSGFWGGISIGRLVWGYCIPRLSFTRRKHAIHTCICSYPPIQGFLNCKANRLLGAAIALQLTIWLVKSVAENAAATSLIGLLYGPIFPGCLSMANDVLPAEVHMVAMALISSFGSLGGAIFPLVAGTIMGARGNQALAYLNVALAAAMATLWILFPSGVPTRSPRLA